MLSKTDLKVLEQIGLGNNKISDISTALQKSNKQVYKIVRRLTDEWFIRNSRGMLTARKHTHVNLLLRILAKYSVLSDLLSDSGLEIFKNLLEPKTVKEVIKESGIKKSIIYKKLRRAYLVSLVKKENKRYVLNSKLWPGVKEFIEEFHKFRNLIDRRIPADSVIYHKTKDLIIFSNKSEQEATKTAFSVYEDYGIRILNETYYYVLPRKKLSKKEVFLHSLYVSKKEKTIRHLTYITLFYLKFKKEISGLKDELIDQIKDVLMGERVKHFPPLKEIKEKAEIYGIKVSK